MTRKAKLITALALATILALVALAGRDWRDAATAMTARAERALGVGIALDGRVRLSILRLALTADHVRVLRGDVPLAGAQRLAILLSPAALLRGRLEPAGIDVDQLAVAGLLLDSLEMRLEGGRLSGYARIGGHPVTFAGNHDDSAEPPVEFRLTVPAMGTALRFGGRLEREAGGTAVSGRLSFNGGNLAALLPQWGLPAESTLRAEADLDAGDGLFALTNLKLDGLGSRGTGTLTATDGSPALIEADLTLDHLDLDLWHHPAPARTTLPALLSPARNEVDDPAPAAAPPRLAEPLLPALPALFADLRLRVDSLSWRGQSWRELAVEASIEPGLLVVRRAEATLTPGLRLAVDGTLTGNAFDGRVRANGPGLSARADLGWRPPRLSVTDLHLNRDGVRGQGSLTADWGQDLAVEWRGSYGDWRTLSGRARLSGLPDGVAASDLTLSLGELTAQGRASADFSGPRPRIDADLTAGDINLAELVGKPASAPAAAAKSASGKKADHQRATKQPSAPPASPWSNAPLDWSALRSVDGRLALAARTVQGDFGRLDTPRLALSLHDGTLRLDDLQAGFLGGTLAATGQASAAPLPSWRLEGRLQDLDLALVKPELAGLSVQSSRLGGSFRLTTQGGSSQAMAAGAQGGGRLEGGGGTIAGIDLPAINAHLGRLDNFGNLLALARTGMNGGTTAFSRLSGTFALKDGILSTHDLALVASGGRLGVEGSIDLGRWSTETTLAIGVEGLGSTPLLVRLSGPLDNPRKVVDANALQAALMQGGLGRALGTGDTPPSGGKPLENLFRIFRRR